MSVTTFLYPVFVLVLLAFVTLLIMARERVGSLKRGEVDPADIALREPNWTRRGLQYGNAFLNQFEVPVLFYALIAFIMITRLGDLLLLILAWIFVLSRVVHAYIHTTTNIVDRRFSAYAAGVAVLLAMWVIFFIKVVTA